MRESRKKINAKVLLGTAPKQIQFDSLETKSDIRLYSWNEKVIALEEHVMADTNVKTCHCQIDCDRFCW